MKKGTLKQILLITDGRSNKGEDPRAAAALAYQQGIIVNVIGILNQQQEEESSGLQEIDDISLSGGGVSQLVYQEALSQTVQTVTKQAMTQTIQGFVNSELKQILGSDQTIEDVDPEKRGEIVEVVEELGETSDLEVLVLVDTSASMSRSLPKVKESLIDLSVSLNSRIGQNRFSIFSFPGKRKDTQKIYDWSPQMEDISKVFPKLTSGGITPTGPAIREAVYQFSKKGLFRNMRDENGTEETEMEAWN